MNSNYFIPVVRNIRRLPRWAVQVCRRENRVIAA